MPRFASNQASESRSAAVDLLRGLMVLYIVGWWHLLAHVGTGVAHVNWVTDSLTNLVLGTFTFLSGYVLGTWNGPFNRAALWRFYVRRLLRVYPLYLLALLAFVATWLTDPFSAFKAALLLSMFWPEPPMTLWFITMIMVFYLVAPLLVRFDAKTTLGFVTGLWLLLLTFDQAVRPIDARIVMFFPAFAAGAMWRRFRNPLWANSIWIVGGIFCALFWLTNYKSDVALLAAVETAPMVIAGSITLLLMAERWGTDLGSRRVIQMLSYASFAAYLFHRVVFRVALRLFQPDQEWAQTLYLVAVALPASFFVGFMVQWSYDRAVNWMGGHVAIGFR